MATKNLTLDDVFGPEPAADLNRTITKIVDMFVRKYVQLETTGNFAFKDNNRHDSGSRYAALRRGFSLYMFTESDIAHFLGGIPEGLVKSAFEEMGQRPRVRPLLIGGRGLERWQASQIYKSYDDDVSRRKIADDLQIRLVTVTEAIMRRREIEPQIIEGLRELYGIQGWNKPYR